MARWIILAASTILLPWCLDCQQAGVIQTYAIPCSNEPDGLLFVNVLRKVEIFDHRNPDAGQFDWGRHPPLLLVLCMSYKGSFGVNYHTNVFFEWAPIVCILTWYWYKWKNGTTRRRMMSNFWTVLTMNLTFSFQIRTLFPCFHYHNLVAYVQLRKAKILKHQFVCAIWPPWNWGDHLFKTRNFKVACSSLAILELNKTTGLSIPLCKFNV